MLKVVQAHPEWTLGQLLAQLEGPYGEVLEGLTLAELCDERLSALVMPKDGGPPVDVAQLEQAKRARGRAFRGHVRRVLATAPGFVGASYLRARVGGPRWKLQEALRKLEAEGVIERRGVTSATEYRFVSQGQRAHSSNSARRAASA